MEQKSYTSLFVDDSKIMTVYTEKDLMPQENLVMIHYGESSRKKTGH